MLLKILDAVGTNKPLQSKQMLREDSELLQKNDKSFLGKSSVKTSGTPPDLKCKP